jgi:CzcA family heavy metal efflux pump
MLQSIVEWSIRQRVMVVILAGALLAGGFYASQHAALDVFPEFTPPQVVIQTEAPGLSPSEVEQLVTLPVETTVNALPGFELSRSQSIQGLSVVTVRFHSGTDVYRARQLVAERLAELSGQLPEGVQAPRLAPLTTATGRLLTVGFTSETLTPMDLRDRIQWQLRPRLLALEGVAQVNLFGGEVRQFQVQVYPDHLAAHHLTLTDVLEATRQANGIRGAGFIDNASQRLTLRASGQVRSAAELGEAVIASPAGTPVRLRDVAEVVEAAEPKFGDATINGKPGVVLVVTRQFEGDSYTITERVEAELDKLRAGLEREGITYHPALFRQANFIEVAVSNVAYALLLGAVLVVLVLFLFLFNWRTAFISLTAIPLSLFGAILLLWTFGISLNTLTLGGLAIAVGEVVDDAIIDVENIFRRLRENAQLPQPRSAASVVLAASYEVRSAVVYATFMVTLVFVPVFFLSGLQGRLFAPLGYAYVLSVLVSLVVALTVTPALCMLLLPGRRGGREPPFVRWLQAGYERLLRRLDQNMPLVLTVVGVLLVAAAWAASRFGGEFLPELKENHFVVHMRGLPGTSLEQSLRSGRQVTRVLLQDPAVRSVAQQAGRTELGEDVWGVEYSELEVDLHPLDGEEYERVEGFMRASLSDRAGYSFEMLPFLSERIKETLSGYTATLAVKVSGDDLETVDQTATEVAEVLEGIPGHADVRVEAQKGSPELVIRIRPQDAARYGLRTLAILDAVHAAYQGASVGQVYDRNRVIDVKVILEPNVRGNVQQVANLWLTTPEGRVPLTQVADVYLSDGRFLIAHENGLRRQVVTCNVLGRDVESFAAEVERRVGEMRWPQGITVAVTGEHEARRTAQRELLLLASAAGLGVLLLLGMALRSFRALVLVLVNLPFALIGGVAAIYLRGGVLDVGGMIGFVTLFGITVRNSLMMVSHWQHLHDQEGMPWGMELVLRGVRERLAPVLMTALTTGLALLPIALGSGEAGREVEGPMAVVILGGLATSTGLNLIVLPLLYRRVGLGPRDTNPTRQ